MRSQILLLRIFLDRPLAAGAETVLSPDERERAARFVHERHRHRFVVGRVGLRTALAGCLGANAAELRFSYSERGRPGLAEATAAGLDFNLGHSGDLALLAVARRRVGVDVERLRPLGDAMAIARRFFSPGECAVLAGLSADGLLAQGFFNAWTRKEALIKASGAGIGALEDVEVSLSPGAAPLVLAAPGGAGSWQLMHVEPATDMVGAVAFEASRDEPVRLTTLTWPAHDQRSS